MFESGIEIDGYQIIEMIGRGGFATDYRALDTRLRRNVILRIVNDVFASHPEYAERFKQAYLIGTAVEHPHIMPVYAYGEFQAMPYIITRMVRGRPLANIEAELLPPAKIGDVLLQVADALDYLHENSIIHRDIKPRTIWLDNRGFAYLTDFEIALRLDDGDPDLEVVVGTPRYIAPEVWTGSGLSAAVDQYSLAVTLFELLTGTSPFDAGDYQQLAYKHLTDAPPSPLTYRKDLPQAVEGVLWRGLAKIPHERFPSCTALIEAYIDALNTIADKTRIFISYRRADSAMAAGRIYDHLARHFGPDQIFMDVDGIQPGEDFVDTLQQKVSACVVLIAVMGKHWLTIDDASGRRRLDSPKDFVRLEVATALQRGITVIPVLIEDALMPGASDLPSDLERLPRQNAMQIHAADFGHGVGRLVETLENFVSKADDS